VVGRGVRRGLGFTGLTVDGVSGDAPLKCFAALHRKDLRARPSYRLPWCRLMPFQRVATRG